MCTDCAVNMHGAQLALLIVMAGIKLQVATYCPYIDFLHLLHIFTTILHPATPDRSNPSGKTFRTLKIS